VELRWNSELRWLNVKPRSGGDASRLFTAQVERLKTTYTFSARSFLRVIGQYTLIERNPALYDSVVLAREGSLTASALFAYKLNWQTVLFIGYGDNRTLSEDDHFERADRQLFLKLSYAFQK
jgi:hypothetical protein